VSSPPAPLTDITAQTSGTTHAKGGTQGEAFWGVHIQWYGACPEHSVSKGGLECGCAAGYGPSGDGRQCVPVSVVALANSQPCECAGGPEVGKVSSTGPQSTVVKMRSHVWALSINN
jgi:hypothetical protein